MAQQRFRLTSAKGGPWYEYYHEACPICGTNGGCMIHENGEKVICIREESDRPWGRNSALPGYLHFLGEKKNVPKSSVAIQKGSTKQSDSILNFYFRSFILFGKLLPAHREHLNSRPLTDKQIDRREYRSFPSNQQYVTEAMRKDLDVKTFKGIPGFYTGYGKDFIHGFSNSFLIPYRNIRNEIVGFQMRVDEVKNTVIVKNAAKDFNAKVFEQPNFVQCDLGNQTIWKGKLSFEEDWKTIYEPTSNEKLAQIKLKKGTRYFWFSSANKNNGTGAGNPTPIHVSIPSNDLKNWKVGQVHKAKTVWLGEGALKGDIAVDKLVELYRPDELNTIGKTFINVPGVNAWRVAMLPLKEMGVETINVAFDADAVNNSEVKHHLFDCLKELKKEGYHANLVVWNPDDGKGIDDTLINGKIPQFQHLF